MTAPAFDRETILRIIREWPLNEQVALADDILAAIRATAKPAVTPPNVPSAALRGILANNQPSPSDEDVARMLEEERMRRADAGSPAPSSTRSHM